MLFEVPVAYQAAYQQPTGSRFGGDALFNGENRKFGARLRYYFKSKEKTEAEKEAEKKDEDEEEEDTSEEDEKKISKDSLYLKIYDGSRLIRTLKRKIPDSTGIYNWRWLMREAGGDRPSRTIEKRKKEPSGVRVKPGSYRAELTYLEQKTSTQIKVESDPRLTISQKAIDDVYSSGKELQKMTQTAADAVKQLVESKTTAKEFKKKLKKEDAKKYKPEIKATGKIVKKIDSIIAFYIGKEDKRQGITLNPEVNVMQRIRTARRYSNSRPNGLTATERQLIKQSKDALKEALQNTNTFFGEEWEAYRSKIEKVDLSPFKESRVFTIE